MTTEKFPRIGVLALQGAFRLHQPHLEAANCLYHEVTNPRDFKKIDGLIIPGGESGVILKLLTELNLSPTLISFAQQKPIWGICAGAILLAKSVSNPTQKSFNLINIEIERNSYGRQIDSSKAMVTGYEVSFIRAPQIKAVGQQTKVLAYLNETPTWVESENVIVTCFHPETNALTPSPWHLRFKQICLPP